MIMKKEVFVLRMDWRCRHDESNDVLGVFDTKEKAINALANVVKQEKEDSWIAHYVKDGVVVPPSADSEELWDVVDTPGEFSVSNFDYSYYTSVWIEPHMLQ